MFDTLEDLATGYTVALIIALIATVLSFVFIIPESRKKTLNGFFTFLHNTFNFKYLVIEKILQFVYVLLTFLIIIVGFIIMFDMDFITGLIMVVVGPIGIRITFEATMMVIIAIKNIIQINEKLPSKHDKTEDESEEPAHQQETPSYQQYQQAAPSHPQAPSRRFCASCGSPTDANGVCSNPDCPKHYYY